MVTFNNWIPLNFYTLRLFSWQQNISFTIIKKSYFFTSIRPFFNLSEVKYSLINFQPRKYWNEFNGNLERRFKVKDIDNECLNYRLFLYLLFKQSHNITMKFFDILFCWFFEYSHFVFILCERLNFYFFITYTTITIFELFCILFWKTFNYEISASRINFYFRHFYIFVECFENRINLLVAVVHKKYFLLDFFANEQLTYIDHH